MENKENEMPENGEISEKDIAQENENKQEEIKQEEVVKEEVSEEIVEETSEEKVVEENPEIEEESEANSEESEKSEQKEANIEETKKPEQEETKESELVEDNAGETEMAKIDENEKEVSKDSEEKETVQMPEQEDKQMFKQAEVKPEKGKHKVATAITITVILIAVMLFSVIFSLIHINDTKILSGISILGIDVSNLTVDEAKKRVNDAINEKFTNESDNIILKREKVETSVNANTFNAKFDVDTAVAEAYNIGKGGNIITNNYAILWTNIFKKNIEPELHYDAEFMKTTINDIQSKMPDSIVEYSYYIEGKNLIVVKGKAGYAIKSQELEEKIKEQLENVHTPYKEIEIPVEYKEPSTIDLEKIRNEIYKEPKDAYVEKNPTKVHVEENGIDFGISMEEAQKLIQGDKKEYEIPLKITAPKKKLSDLGEEAFPDQLATFSTIYDASARNRAANIELATKKINGTVIMPGETFSYNKVVGSRTIEAGWKEGTAYIGGKVVPSVGGGVCQVSSTLYNTALLANLEITERTNHTFTVDYVSASRDATVYYGSLDFCFKNSRSYPIKIVASAKNGVCKISLKGIKEKVEYEVIIQSKVTSYINNTTTYKQDPTLEEGKEVVEQIGFNGCRSEGYKILKLNGKVVSQTLLSKDTYSPQERIVRRGTKKVVKPTTTQD